MNDGGEFAIIFVVSRFYVFIRQGRGWVSVELINKVLLAVLLGKIKYQKGASFK